MKRCPVCNARCFSDMKICYGCLHRFEEGDEVCQLAQEDEITLEEPRDFAIQSAVQIKALERGKTMLLVIDVGNTQTVLGVFDSAELRRTWRIATDKKQTADEIHIVVNSLMGAAGISLDEITAAALASVVPCLTDEWKQALQSLTGSEPVVCTAAAAEGLFEADYPNPEEIGQDRVADAIAARAVYGAPVIVVDFGTATNIEVIDRRGCFCGGIIAPGVKTSMSALFGNASRLSVVELDDPGRVIGKNTTQAIQSGIVYGEAERVDGLLNRIYDELGYKARVVATGGLSAFMANHSREITHVDCDLTLQGLRLLYEAKTAKDGER